MGSWHSTWASTWVISEGWRVTERLLKSRFKVTAVVMSERRTETYEGFVPEEVPLFVTNHAVVEQLVGFKFHGGVLAAAVRPAQPTFEDWISADSPTLSPPAKDIVVAFPRVQDPDNVGLILRNCAAFGVQRVLVGSRSASPLSRRGLRLSMGASLLLSIRETESFDEDLQRLHTSLGYERIAAMCEGTSVPLMSKHVPNRVCLVLGSESEGLDPGTAERCDSFLHIPMANEMSSLNVSSAAAVILHHWQEGHRSR